MIFTPSHLRDHPEIISMTCHYAYKNHNFYQQASILSANILKVNSKTFLNIRN